MTNKKRLDQIMVDNGLAQSRERAKALIMSGNVVAEGFEVLKPGTFMPEDTVIRLKKEDFPYVSRGALKLKEAVEKTGFNVSGLVCMDIGASTGGFTDYLIQNGAEKVYAIDVGYGQLAWKLRQDSRVEVFERTNIRNLDFEQIGEKVDLIVCDTSFISLKIVIPSALKFLKKNADIFALIKPQFEAGKQEVKKGGVVRDKAVHDRIIEDLTLFFKEHNLAKKNLVPSPIKGPKGNQEYIIQLTLDQ
ncbi:MAG: TlyA family RNA methyltransferase [Desulfobacteraceae bacterium]|nr:TlyA family RNA methyltransferase [Desulfobacteraceae bacterium]